MLAGRVALCATSLLNYTCTHMLTYMLTYSMLSQRIFFSSAFKLSVHSAQTHSHTLWIKVSAKTVNFTHNRNKTV